MVLVESVGNHQDAEEITETFKDTKAVADYFIITGDVRITSTAVVVVVVVVVQSEVATLTNTQTVLDCSSLRKWGM